VYALDINCNEVLYKFTFSLLTTIGATGFCEDCESVIMIVLSAMVYSDSVDLIAAVMCCRVLRFVSACGESQFFRTLDSLHELKECKLHCIICGEILRP